MPISKTISAIAKVNQMGPAAFVTFSSEELTALGVEACPIRRAL